MKIHFKSTSGKRLRIPSRTTLRRYISTVHDFFPERTITFLQFWNLNPVGNDTSPNLYNKKHCSIDFDQHRCIRSRNQNYNCHCYEDPPERLDVTLRPAMLPKHKRLQLAYAPVCPLHDLPAAAAADIECVRLLTCCHAVAFPPVVVLLRSQHPISTRPLPPPLYSPQQSASDHDISRDFPNQSSQRVAHSLATVRLLAKLIFQTCFPRCAITPYLLPPQPSF